MIKSAAILISRQGLHPCQTTSWIVQLKKAIDWLKNKSYHLYTSVGQQTWELQIFFAKQFNLEQTIVIPANNAGHFENLKQTVIEHFCLDTKKIQFEKVHSKNLKSLLYQRDAQIISNSDILIPISIRKKGHMKELISTIPAKNKVMNQFQIDYRPEKANISYQIDTSCLSKKVRALSSSPYLIHWTRASNTHWPTENKYSYYQAITNSDAYPRNAFASLENMLTYGQIKASSRHMPQKTATVSFSGLPPKDAVSLMHWRARYCQMSFEPYGIGIEKTYALSAGIQKVQYYQPGYKPKGVSPWRCQSIGKRSDWRLEDEYRHLGDLDLLRIPNDKKVSFCYRYHEAQKIQNQFGIRGIAMVD
jgi:hypothetical protein